MFIFILKFAHFVLGAIELDFSNNFKKTSAFFKLHPYSISFFLTDFIVDLTTLLFLLFTWWFYRALKTYLANKRRRLLLALFHCPLQMGNRRHRQQSCCPFGHCSGTIKQRQKQRRKLRDLPEYLCTDHLLNCCTQYVPTVLKNNAISVCVNGFHLTSPFDDLLDLTAFEHQNQQQIGCFITADDDRQCAICLEMVVLKKQFPKERQFALLQHCNHVFCAQCLIRWAKKDYHNNRYLLRSAKEVICPLCMTISRFIVSCRFTDDPKQKAVLFKK